MKRLAAVLVLSLLVAPAVADDEPWATDLDRRMLATHTETYRTGPLVFHSEKGAFDDAALSEIAKANLAEFRRLEKLLAMEYEGEAHVFLYRDVAELKSRTGAADAWAFATGTRSIHQPRDFVSVHEFAHLFALQIPRGEDSVDPEFFFVDGLATALAGEDEAIPIHAWAAAYARAERLPGLVALRRTWPKGVAAGVHPYHVAGSFVLYLIDRYGIEKVKALYVNCLECGGILGRSFALLEQDWRKMLDGYDLPPAQERHVRAKLGLPTLEPLPERYAKAKGTRLFDGRTLGGWSEEHAGRWQVKGGKLAGSSDGDWTHLVTKVGHGAAVGVRARARLVEGDALGIRVNATAAGANDAILARWKTFLTVKTGGYLAIDGFTIEPGRWYDLVLVSEKGRAKLYVDGRQYADLPDAFRTDDGAVAIGVTKGKVEVESIEVFRP
jgi:hypothetical protein